jgi:hypothetical protein
MSEQFCRTPHEYLSQRSINSSIKPRYRYQVSQLGTNDPATLTTTGVGDAAPVGASYVRMAH